MQFSGTVERHTGRGTDIGYPTANIALPEGVEHGIYAAWVQHNDTVYRGAVFCGVAEMFSETEAKAEVHILDFNKDISGEVVKVELVKKIRDVESYSSEQELIVQIEQDIKDIETCLQESQPTE